MNPFQEAPQSKKMTTIVALYLALICNTFISTSFSGMLPLAAGEFKDGAIWPLAMAIGGILGLCIMPIFGYIGAKNPAIKRPFVSVSLVIGAAVLIARGSAQNMMTIVVASVFWGFVSGSIFVLGFSMVRDMFDRKESGTYLGLLGTVMSVGMLAGPFLSGIILDRFGWRPLNFVIGALLVLSAILVWAGVKVTKAEAAPLASASGTFDFAGAAAMTVFLACFIIAMSMTSYFPLGGTVNNILLVLAVIALIALIFIIKTKKQGAFIPSAVFADRNSVVFAVCNFLTLFSTISLNAFLPAYIRIALGEDSIVTTIGISLASLLPAAGMAIPGLFLGPVFGGKIAKAGDARGVLTFGTIVRFASYLALLLAINEVLGPLSYIAIIVIMLVFGVANSQNSVTFSAGPQIQIKPELRVQSNSIIQVGQSLGAGLAIPIYSLVIATCTAPFVATHGAAASAMGLLKAMPIILTICLVVIALLFVLGFFLRPLAKEET
ncbi:MAG: MFS transporter [Spirochaetales bacterium]|nr:MFS transporter [Spirochaetales bacterium]